MQSIYTKLFHKACLIDYLVFALWLLFWWSLKRSESYVYLLRQLPCSISVSLLLKVLHALHLAFTNIFPNQLCIYSSQLTRHFQMNAVSSEWPKFVNDIIQPHWKNCTCKWMLMLVNYPCNFCMLRHVLPIAFSYLGLHPITCQFLVNNLHFIMYSALTGQNPDRKQPNKEPIVLYMPTQKSLKHEFFPFVQ